MKLSHSFVFANQTVVLDTEHGDTTVSVKGPLDDRPIPCMVLSSPAINMLVDGLQSAQRAIDRHYI